jgi:hypothetical protein
MRVFVCAIIVVFILIYVYVYDIPIQSTLQSQDNRLYTGSFSVHWILLKLKLNKMEKNEPIYQTRTQ